MALHLSSRSLLSASVLLAGLAGVTAPALALDADDFATKLAAFSSQGGGKMSFASIEPDGSTVVLKSMRVETPGRGSIDLGTVTFSGIEERDDGGYHAEKAQMEDIRVTDGPTTVSVTELQMSDIIVPSDKPTYEISDTIDFYGSITTGEIRFDHEGDKIFTIAGTRVTTDREADGSRIDVSMSASDLWIDLGQIEDPKARQGISGLGYETLSGDLDFDGTWHVDTGVLNISEFLSLDDVGRLSLSMEVSGYTMQLITAMQQAQATAAKNPDRKAAQQAMGFAMLGLLQQLSFNSASVQFEDASLTERALEVAGKQQGVSGDQMAQALKAMLPLMLGRLGIPELQKQIAAAASVYLDNPQSINITAAPASPVAIPVIMGAGMGDPKSLVGLLNVQISANKPVEICCKQ